MQRLFSAIKTKRDRAIFVVAYRHGSEVGMLQRKDVDLKAARITINRVKGSMSGVYPMSPDTVKLVRSYLKAERTLPLTCLYPIVCCPLTGAPCWC